MLNKIKNYMIVVLILVIAVMGVYIFVQRGCSEVPSKPNTIELKENESTKAVINKNKVTVIHKENGKVVYKEKIINPNEKETKVIIKEDGEIVIESKNFQLLPLTLHTSTQILPGIEPTVGLKLIRYKQYGLSGNVNKAGLSVSLDRDIGDIVPQLSNSFVGLYSRYNFDGSRNYGFCFGVYF